MSKSNVSVFPDAENSPSEAALEPQTSAGFSQPASINFAFVFEVLNHSTLLRVWCEKAGKSKRQWSTRMYKKHRCFRQLSANSLRPCRLIAQSYKQPDGDNSPFTRSQAEMDHPRLCLIPPPPRLCSLHKQLLSRSMWAIGTGQARIMQLPWLRTRCGEHVQVFSKGWRDPQLSIAITFSNKKFIRTYILYKRKLCFTVTGWHYNDLPGYT